MNDRRILSGIVVVTKRGLGRRDTRPAMVPARHSSTASAAGAVSPGSEAGVEGRSLTLPRFTAVVGLSATPTGVTPNVEAVWDLRCCWFLREESSHGVSARRSCAAERGPLS